MGLGFVPTDPAFPNRPDHKDFYALALTVQDNDHAADNATDGMFDDMIARHVDKASLLYMAQQRALRSLQLMRMEMVSRGVDASVTNHIESAMIGTWVDGFMCGVNFDFKRHAFTIVDATKPDA